MEPELNLGTPSILMTSVDVAKTYEELVERGVTTNPVMDLGFMKVISFADNDGNYYAIREVK
ncbi:lactoylglutathione lyase and related lyases [Streptococcus suis]|nr:lactoylglutathione lyase and related lyases [Streptococcus suis]CYX81590.1 lactoylglutathione lyase and related lyases [Streptococcus suis]CYX82816.1 lactoylglutathione lyase and related lyases [Streptococcus suis]CYX83500.1 lactoylglutathione lyase and related lyases [Streptococcus suis]CYX83985.1 lactoylglutathione lyase and related lyases [Streptococcus suis]